MHYRPFMAGKIHLKDVVYYLSVTVFFLSAATRMLESRRWR
jgi:ABC-2 type transport system permease protein